MRKGLYFIRNLVSVGVIIITHPVKGITSVPAILSFGIIDLPIDLDPAVYAPPSGHSMSGSNDYPNFISYCAGKESKCTRIIKADPSFSDQHFICCSNVPAVISASTARIECRMNISASFEPSVAGLELSPIWPPPFCDSI